MISLLDNFNNCANVTNAVFALPHAAEIPNTILSINALSDRNRFGLSRAAQLAHQRMIVRLRIDRTSVIACQSVIRALQKVQ
ncbi:hypothetical protein [Caballeronia novacaledonica]|uniref:hypothetical protein n=1 Tax=Caballeronia novacaledonica TaxID=1544861 RepID=UPI0011B28E80|nr:hypothetical protein [Caballeronia novacaledonica]